MMNMGSGGSGQLAVPPGFRFHPTDEELLYYYLRKKVSYEPIDLDVIREVDLNKLEPWDLKEKCRIGSGPQNEWYFFSHKDKKYPTGTRTNRATAAGFWKATGRDKAIHMADSKRIGMRKTLVFYTGRAPHGHKTDWIMHEYRLDDHHDSHQTIQEDGWVVCRVFKKKSHIRGGGGYQQHDITNNTININSNAQMEDFSYANNMKASGSSSLPHHHHHHHQPLYDHHHDHDHDNYPFDATMHLPQLFSPDSNPVATSYAPALSLAMQDIDCSQSLLSLTSNALVPPPPPENHSSSRPFHAGAGDWTFLDKLLASSGNSSNAHHHALAHHQAKCNPSSSPDLQHHHRRHHQDHVPLGIGSTQRLFPFQYLGCDTADVLKFPK